MFFSTLDKCIQGTLSSLYRPFSVTASTVLWQLFSVVERQYRGDGLRCFIDFLLPAKRILQIIHRETCLRFRGLLLYDEGWPLCLHEKVILQLAPLHKVRLKQGDFYLQIVPLGRKAAKLVIKCLSASGQAVAEIPILEGMYGSVFTAEFLQNVTRDRNLHPLQNCLLTTGTAVYRTAWTNVVNPLFVSSTADAIMQARCSREGFHGHLSTCSTNKKNDRSGTLSLCCFDEQQEFILSLVVTKIIFFPSAQTETVSSLKALHKHIDPTQLTRDLEDWGILIEIGGKVWTKKVETIPLGEPEGSAALFVVVFLFILAQFVFCQDVSEVLEQQRQLMNCVLDDTRLNRLRLEGGTVLARIRKEEACENECYRDTVDVLNALYNQVDEEVHKLVILSNKSQKELGSLLEVRNFEEQTQQVSLNQRHGLQLVKNSPESLPDSVLIDFKQHLGSILSRAEQRKAILEILTNLYEFYDSANQWMDHCQDFFRQLSLDTSDGRVSSSVVQILQDYCKEASKFSEENFSALNTMVLSLESPQQLQLWSSVWHRCQKTKQQLEETLAQAVQSDQSSATEDTEESLKTAKSQLFMPDHQKVQDCLHLSRTIPSWTIGENKCHSAGPFSKSSSSLISSSCHFLYPPDCENKLKQSSSTMDDTDSDCTIDSTISCHSEPVNSKVTRLRKHPMKKIMKKTMSYELTQRDNVHSDVSHIHGYTGVYIKGLEVTNNVSAEKKLQRPDVTSPVLGRSRSMSTPCRSHNRRSSDGEGKKQSSKVQHIMDEMISTEREYVRSLCYIIEHYFPEMERLDLPQDLRGKRSIIFGNVEKLWDFHSQYFSKELEASAHSPLSISSCFLRHEDQFGMYALYSKNKPQSDALLSSHGNEFFKNKQLELGDKMDLASYLLKPIQRMSKYALLLKDLIKECSQTQEQELSDLRTAEEMVKFQLRHGNDLLAMDAIRGCDVNLKEQGQLRCQDEFIVWCGRRKYLRHVFLFEDLILFSKTKKIEGGYDIYIYKQSFKTAEIGMTENVGDSGLRFEIWFRRRKSQDTFILQASSAEVKAVWTAIIGKILWRQALRNRELRMQEMVSMGIGSKPFMDIKPSDAAISDRAIDYIMKGSESRSRASIAVSSFEHCTAFKRPHSTISNSSTSSSSSQSSSSLLGSLNLHLYSSPSHPHVHLYPMGSMTSFVQWPYDCIEEDELEQDSGCSQPSMITESSETSSQCNSSDSVTGLSTLTIPESPSIAMDSFNSNEPSPFLSSSTPSSSSISTSPIFPKDEELQPQGTKFITAVSTIYLGGGGG
uniref:Pleckstrin homology and RhoGEF domain containing G4B n=1 Tax=Oryzias sinensis TaxID=183150 RepID=A0A8C8DJI4_9TELE